MNEAPFRCSTLGLAPGLAHKHYNKRAILVRDKHSSLLRKSVNYEQKSFVTLGPIRDKYSSLFSPFVSYKENEVLLILPHDWHKLLFQVRKTPLTADLFVSSLSLVRQIFVAYNQLFCPKISKVKLNLVEKMRYFLEK
jgi:hypothetical protein